MGDYWYAEWIEGGSTTTAQTDKGLNVLKNHAGVYTGSGKIMLSIYSITKWQFESNKKNGVKTI